MNTLASILNSDVKIVIVLWNLQLMGKLFIRFFFIFIKLCFIFNTLRSNNCDKETGKCSCTSNTDGRRCDHCKNGFYDYPDCLECSCNRNGTTNEICDKSTADCLCKPNVYGEQCTDCKEGTFNLAPANKDGCTKCFCFGQTTRCMSADLYTKTIVYFKPNEFEDWDEWRLRNAVESVKLINATTHEGLSLEIDEEIPVESLTEPIYWIAPKPFIGNKVTSYGSSIRYNIKIEAPEDANELNRADLIIASNSSNMILIHTGLNKPQSSETFEKEISLVEGEFFHLATGAEVSREQLMQVLSSISSIQLRASYYDEVHSSELINFEYDHAVEASVYDANISMPVLNAERCACPPTYRGYSCESCDYGYYKTVSRGPGRFNCERCKCNGHASTCDQETGKCFECQGSTEGHNCERCKAGYHKIEHDDGSFECRLCTCPGNTEETVFADTCMIDANTNNAYFCNCREGYFGNYCERCAPGYFGSPSDGIPCKKCQCNDNIDMTDFNSCDQTTGECLRCLNNTTGANCEKCNHWHFGDPIELKNCQKCECDECGSSECDKNNGECTCKPNVIGDNCASCGNDQWGFNLCQGCNNCECDPTGSLSSECDAITGQCKCKKGVDGRKCDMCKPDHWNFTSSGCKSCECFSKGVQVSEDTGGFTCNSITGDCSCIPGVKGKLCNECDARWVLDSHKGCRKCDTCVDTLLDDLDILYLTADSIQNGNKNSSLTFKAHNKVALLEKQFNELNELKDSTESSQLPLQSLQATINDIKDRVMPELEDLVSYPIDEKLANLEELLVETEAFDKNVAELRDDFEILEQLITQLKDTNAEDESESIETIERDLNVYRTIVDGIIQKKFGQSEAFLNETKNFEKLNKTVEDLALKFNTQMKEIEKIKSQNKYIKDSLAELRDNVNRVKNLEEFKEKDVEFNAFFNSLKQIEDDSKVLQETSNNNLISLKELIQDAAEKLEESKDSLIDLDTSVAELEGLYGNHDAKYNKLKELCSQAEDKSANITHLSRDWSNRVSLIQLKLALIVFYSYIYFFKGIKSTTWSTGI